MVGTKGKKRFARVIIGKPNEKNQIKVFINSWSHLGFLCLKLHEHYINTLNV